MYVDLTRSSVDLLRLRKQALATNDNTLSVSLTLEDGSTYSEKGHLALTEVAVDESTGSVTLRAVFPTRSMSCYRECSCAPTSMKE
ncbi:Probable efflux pump periplasmic linker ttgA precursor [Raoultella planticola]|uniref:Probable efflux pump periplasmic linker ttgA n=1 Tax=Raoultella planticola TaxID=575 RepID=A0A485BPE1_RAOPL|nr:Probable efflux pump periplasmic linker ttgA precursor [Raoultella planticola]